MFFNRAGMPHYFALIPAAGCGARMAAELPKQYLPLLGRPMIYHAVKALCGAAEIERVYVVLAPQDAHWEQHDWQAFAPKLHVLFVGGETRAQSVQNGLEAMRPHCQLDDWVLVHDAARPCISRQHLAKLIDEVGADEVGGLLAMPVADTLKRADAQGRVQRTEPRDNLWQAQTPQMFRHGLLLQALQAMGDEAPTDESRAIERLGLNPRLVASDGSNLKVTYPEDLLLAQLILHNRESQA
jgi:2-C-methyl-D-erythritol 4-phosphate cytidylyltransferase